MTHASQMLASFYKGKRVAITGVTGFKGAWLAMWLRALGAEVYGLGLSPESSPSLYEIVGLGQNGQTKIVDIRQAALLRESLSELKPSIIFHLAAQSLVRRSYAQPVQTYETNVMGTLYLLEAARSCGTVRAFVNVTTDKCYENRETMAGYREDEAMGGHDMYSSSKGCAELLSSSYRRSFLGQGSFALATARAGNVIGGGDWAADRLVPDCVRALEAGQAIEIRNPSSIRPWQHVLPLLSGYLLLGQKLWEEGSVFAEAFNFGPDKEEKPLTVGELAALVVAAYGRGEVLANKNDGPHEATLLWLNADKAKNRLGWQPAWKAAEAVRRTVDWYKAFYEGKDMKAFSLAQIEAYQREADL